MTDYTAPVGADLMTGLGKIVAGWAHVDQCMGEFLAFLVQGNPAFMYAITNSVSASTVSGWIRTLLAARYGDDNPPAEIMALLDNVDRLR